MTFIGQLEIHCSPRTDTTGTYFCVQIFPSAVNNADDVFTAVNIGPHAPLAVADALEEIAKKIRRRVVDT